MSNIEVKSKIEMPEYVKDGIRALVRTVTDKDVDISIDFHRGPKTEQQRKYFWALVKNIREKLRNGQTEDDVYLKILRENGVSDWLALPEEQVYIARDYYRIVEDKGETVLTTPSKKEIKARQLKCWKGLSQYTINEACMLIDGAVEDCKALGIPTDTPEEIRRMKEQWGVDIGKETA